MENTRIFKMAFASVYPHYIQKAEKKGRTKEEVDIIICWLTGYDPKPCSKKLMNSPILKPFLQRLRKSIRTFQKLPV